ncbi:NAD(P)-binding protein [Ceratobasidium sp. AG-I]|nr:NAD(P)-binding protein [Ceratobasidium sp. AG-I]
MGALFSRTPSVQPDLRGRVLMVTGANRGIGFQTAKQLYKLGGTVYLGARTEENARRAIERIRAEVQSDSRSCCGSGIKLGSDVTAGELKWFPLDLSSVAKARESAEWFLGEEERLDVIVNNACLGDAPFEVNEDGVENMMAINHVGHFVLTTTLLDLMKRTSERSGADVRIVNVSSTVHGMWGKGTQISFSDPTEFSKPFPAKNPDSWKNILTRYSRTKLANILFTKELQRRLDKEDSGIITVSIHPGYVATEAAKVATSKMPFLGLISNVLVKLFFIDEASGARNSVYAAAHPRIRVEAESFKGQFMTPVGKVMQPSALAQDEDLSKDLWTLTEGIVERRMGP